MANARTFVWLLLFGLSGPCQVVAAGFDEPEDSPLFADSVHQAFAQFASQDRVPLAAQGRARPAAPTAGEIIVIEGTRWHSLAAEATPATPAGGPRRVPMPLMVTVNGATCPAEPSCNGPCPPTTHAGPTCFPLCPTGGMPTCTGDTCGSGTTCSPMNTCQGPTCYGGGITCYPSVTCSSTCASTCTPGQCRTNLYGITIPQAGQIQMSFNSSSLLRYTLQYSTNLPAGQWMDVSTVNGNGGQITLSHTNNADRSYYRLWIQNQ